MLNDQSTSTLSSTRRNHGREEQNNNNINDQGEDDQYIREIHALTPPLTTTTATMTANLRRRIREAWETQSHQSSSLSTMASIEGVAAGSSENLSTMSREFSALVLAGSNNSPMNDPPNHGGTEGSRNLERIREDDIDNQLRTMMMEETNPLAIVPDNNPLDPVIASSPTRHGGGGGGGMMVGGVTISGQSEVWVQRVKKEEIEAKIAAWQNAKVAKINNRFKREDSVISGWENEQLQKTTSWMNKVERKLEEKRAKALEKMQNEVAKAHRKAEERRASAEAKRGTKVARVLEVASLMKALGRTPTKRSFF
ncbi:hypothetical protein HN51_047798 [Arachis hypogaea]|uniref:Remorin C-terminal domain-containing protein n=1 Tax=Arachis hypogaea TaxID=3818 RepID=A0A445AI62_ARAHY|nr:remorin 4.1 [Arachis ipaensis]XP_025633215.1 remorin 4.2 [Arachis hypogaea]QHO24186.1 putative protein-like [Arachis hypogaea]RYR26137.1 hypothetical protein Ahy_B02g060295 [Arachis hypogaea]